MGKKASAVEFTILDKYIIKIYYKDILKEWMCNSEREHREI